MPSSTENWSLEASCVLSHTPPTPKHQWHQDRAEKGALTSATFPGNSAKHMDEPTPWHSWAAPLLKKLGEQ